MSHRAGLSIGVRKSDPAQREIDCDPKLATVRGQLFQGDRAMRVILSTVSMAAALVATEVSAQSVNLTGRWQCVAFCVAPPGRYAFITQNGWEINVVNSSGVASRAWFNWPGRISGGKGKRRRGLFSQWVHAPVRPRNCLAARPGTTATACPPQ